MLVAVEPRLEPAPAVADRVEHEHPATPQPEPLAGPRVAVDRVHHPQAEGDEGQPDDPAHHRVEPLGQQRAERDGGQPEGDDDRAVTERVERAQPDGIGLPGQEPRPADGRTSGERGRERRATGPGVVRPDLAVAAVAVAVTGDVAVLLDVGRIGHAGGRGRARDVGDRGDVVPVDAVADAEQQPGQQDAEVHGGRGGGCAGTDEIDHVEVLAGRVSRVADTVDIATGCN